MNYLKIFTFILLSLSIFPFSAQSQHAEISPERIIQNMLSSIEGIHTLSYDLRNSERFDGNLISGEYLVKYSSRPKKCHFYMIYPEKGSELVYVDGANKNKAIYNPTGFPYFKVKLDPLGESMRDQNHHTIYEAGFEYFGKVIKEAYGKDQTMFKYKGETVWEGREVYRIEMDNKIFRYLDYVPGKEETPRDIAQKLIVNEHKIIELNPDIDKYAFVPEGKKITVPNFYARRMELLIDKKNYLPIRQAIYDDIGLFEVYEFVDLKLNPKIDDEEFEI